MDSTLHMDFSESHVIKSCNLLDQASTMLNNVFIWNYITSTSFISF